MFSRLQGKYSHKIALRRSKEGLNDYLTCSSCEVLSDTHMGLGHRGWCLISISVMHTVSKALLRKLIEKTSYYVQLVKLQLNCSLVPNDINTDI